MLVSGFGEHNFTLGVAELAECSGGYVEGDGTGCAEHGGSHVDVFDVDEDAGAEPDLVEGVVVFAHRLGRQVVSMVSLCEQTEKSEAVTYELIVRSAGVVSPRRLLHDLSGHGLKVHEVVASGERGHPLYALQTAGLLGVKRLFFLLHGAHVNLAEVLGLVQVLVQGVRRVDRLELLGRIFACVLENDFLAARVL